jgi:hypothetical protein
MLSKSFGFAVLPALVVAMRLMLVLHPSLFTLETQVECMQDQDMIGRLKHRYGAHLVSSFTTLVLSCGSGDYLCTHALIFKKSNALFLFTSKTKAVLYATDI